MSEEAPTGHALVAENLWKRYGGEPALRGVSLAVPAGRITGLLGRNGSGKSTLIRIALGLEAPTAGLVRVLGRDSRGLDPATRGRIGYLGEGHPHHAWMRVREAVAYERGFRRDSGWDQPLCDRVLDHFRLGPKQKIGGLSRGQRGGLTLALVLAANPELLILDDPALGLDPVARQALLEAMLFATRDATRTILFSSHDLVDVERLADRIVVIDRGVVRADCEAAEMAERVRWLSAPADASPADRRLLEGFPGLVRGGAEAGGWRGVVVLGDGGEPTPEQAQTLAALAAPARLDELPLPAALAALMDEPGTRPGFLEALAEPEAAVPAPLTPVAS